MRIVSLAAGLIGLCTFLTNVFALPSAKRAETTNNAASSTLEDYRVLPDVVFIPDPSYGMSITWYANDNFGVGIASNGTLIPAGTCNGEIMPDISCCYGICRGLVRRDLSGDSEKPSIPVTVNIPKVPGVEALTIHPDTTYDIKVSNSSSSQSCNGVNILSCCSSLCCNCIII
ncbi:hypothetical protein SJAG_03814 [Schizosaccharomyces japonicus yFS275]|uniref:Uncharacterized protein n=1 Tax=Schizosaccharomyces japonicus (strain yFS275 / FY16936) TaxID=402676 RepID=B6K548_SCHJY|nr:hypothetical protein SJAG_03814 [Schizosaccharomyces japonicus yFS275]EEB08652.1 hypothetical protein SJAG_03814 [Schizosaccharomyces japonicus yFS275]